MAFGDRDAAEALQAPASCFSNHFASWPVAPRGLHSGMAPRHALPKQAEQEEVKVNVSFELNKSMAATDPIGDPEPLCSGRRPWGHDTRPPGSTVPTNHET